VSGACECLGLKEVTSHFSIQQNTGSGVTATQCVYKLQVT